MSLEYKLEQAYKAMFSDLTLTGSFQVAAGMGNEKLKSNVIIISVPEKRELILGKGVYVATVRAIIQQNAAKADLEQFDNDATTIFRYFVNPDKPYPVEAYLTGSAIYKLVADPLTETYSDENSLAKSRTINIWCVNKL